MATTVITIAIVRHKAGDDNYDGDDDDDFDAEARAGM